MAQKPKISKNSTPTNANLRCIPSQAITPWPIKLKRVVQTLQRWAKSCTILDLVVVIFNVYVM